MQPGQSGGEATPEVDVPAADTTTGEFSTWRALQKATDTKRANLIADIVGHPTGAPSVEELDYLNPDMSDDAIRRHLQTLIDVDIVRELALEPGTRVRDYPYKFYELTEQARDLFDRNGLFPEDAWRRQYRSVEKTARLRELETMPRPDG